MSTRGERYAGSSGGGPPGPKRAEVGPDTEGLPPVEALELERQDAVSPVEDTTAKLDAIFGAPSFDGDGDDMAPPI